MDGFFNNVLEGTRQYFMGVPKQATTEGSSQPGWSTGALLPEEEALVQSGAQAPSSCPSSMAAVASTTTNTMPIAVQTRPPSEPLEPEPHIIHKATVMREAAEKRREQPEIEEEEEPVGTLSPPPHIIRKPPRLSSPLPAPAPSPSPARPPSAAPLPAVSEAKLDVPPQYHAPVHHSKTPASRPPENFTPSRPPDPYSSSRPPEQYVRYHFEPTLENRSSNSSAASVQPSTHSRHSPQTYARISGLIPQHNTTRLRESAVHSPPEQRYVLPPQQPLPPHNDRVPPIHHPQSAVPVQRFGSDGRSASLYSPLQQRRESSPYTRTPPHYDRHLVTPPRKYDPKQAYPGYRPLPTVTQTTQNHRSDIHHQGTHAQYKHVEILGPHFTVRSTDRGPSHLHDSVRVSTRPEYANIRTIDARSNYHYSSPSTSTARYGSSAPLPITQNPLQTKSTFRSASAPKTSYEPNTLNSVQTSPSRSSESGFSNHQSRMTVSVATLVHQMNKSKQKQDASTSLPTQVNQINQTKQKRESPLDLSVKTVKNSADSSTTQDDVVESMSIDKSIQLLPRSTSSNRHLHLPNQNYVASHKVDFAPNFTQYGERILSQNYSGTSQTSHSPVRHNSANTTHRLIPEPYPVESSRNIYSEQNKYTPAARPNYISKIDLTRPLVDQRHAESKIRDDRHFIIEERKRSTEPIDCNIPEKLLRFETWSSDGRIECVDQKSITQSAREQHELMSQPVYSYRSHKEFEVYQNEQKRPSTSSAYRDQQFNEMYRYPYYPEFPLRESSDYHAIYHEKNPSIQNRHQVIQKIPSLREIQSHHLDSHNNIPANKRVLSILRNSLETKQSGFVDSAKPKKQITELIVMDDVDDSVIDITDLTKENDVDTISKPLHSQTTNLLSHPIQMPKAIDSISRETEFTKPDNIDKKTSKSPENDVASRIRTKAELKVMPPSQDHTMQSESKQSVSEFENEKSPKILPKSQKQHLFNQIRKDNLKLDSIIKSENVTETIISKVKIEPMNLDEIERDAVLSLKQESTLDNLVQDHKESSDFPRDDLDWDNACDSFMEQLKIGCHKKKSNTLRTEAVQNEVDKSSDIRNTGDSGQCTSGKVTVNPAPAIVVKEEPIDEDELKTQNELSTTTTVIAQQSPLKQSSESNNKNELHENRIKDTDKIVKKKKRNKIKLKKNEKKSVQIKTEPKDKEVVTEKELAIKTVIKEELESTDDDEPLIKSKLLKDKEKSDLLNYQLLKDLSEKSAYVKLEFCDVDVNKNTRKSLDSVIKENDDKPKGKLKLTRHNSKGKGKSLSTENNKTENKEPDSSTDSDDDVRLVRRLRMRKNVKEEEIKDVALVKNPAKQSLLKKLDNSSTTNNSTCIRKTGFGDGSDFYPGWEEELYKYKRSLRMPTRLIAIPRGRSGGPFARTPGSMFTRGSTSLPDLDPAPLSPSSALSVATDDIYARRQDKMIMDSDLESSSSSSFPNKLQYDSEASTSTVLSSSKNNRKSNSIVDVLIQKCGKREDLKKRTKDKDDKYPRLIPKKSNVSELLPTPLGLGLMGKIGNNLNNKKERAIEDIFYLGGFRKETVTAFRDTFIENTGGLLGATEEFSPIVLQTRTRTESRVMKQRATIKEVFGDERPASAPPSTCIDDDNQQEDQGNKDIKEFEPKNKIKLKKIIKDKLKRRSSSIRDGLRSTKSLKMNDAKGRLLRLKKRNNLIKTLSKKRLKAISEKDKSEKCPTPDDKDKPPAESSSMGASEGQIKKRFRRLFGRRKFSSGFDYIRKKKKIIRREDHAPKIRRTAAKPKPNSESVHDIYKEIKSWFINKSIGETHLHRAARLGYTDCVAYCLEKMESDPSAKDNAGFTPLHMAAAKGHVRIARLLLQYGANVSAAAQGGIRPLHEASENCHVEVIRLLLAYGADPLLGTYAGRTPEELTEGPAAKLLRLHIADVQGRAIEPWRFPALTASIDREELGCDPLSSPPPSSPLPAPDATVELQCTDAPLPPFYSLRSAAGQPADGLWCLLQDVTNLLQIKSKDNLLKQIHCGSGSPKELLREIRTQEFLERAQCHQLLCAGEKVNVRASKVALVRVTDKLRQLLKIETVLVS